MNTFHTIAGAIFLLAAIFFTLKTITEIVHSGPDVNFGSFLSALLWTMTALLAGWL